MIRRLAMTGFGLGYSPIASGTAGSAGAVLVAFLVWWLHYLCGARPIWLDVAWVLLLFLACVGCVYWGRWAVEYFSSKAGKPGDPSQVVLDEFAGQWLALVALPMPTFERAVFVITLQFFLFRLFDVLKITPARQFEKLPAGWGILTDDLAAAVYANIVGQIVFRVFAI